jgi:hypothetical protein
MERVFLELWRPGNRKHCKRFVIRHLEEAVPSPHEFVAVPAGW